MLGYTSAAALVRATGVQHAFQFPPNPLFFEQTSIPAFQHRHSEAELAAPVELDELAWGEEGARTHDEAESDEASDGCLVGRHIPEARINSP